MVPAPIAAVICAALMLITRVLTLPQFYRGIDWNTCILIGAMIPPVTAMTKNRCGYSHRKLCRQRAGQCRAVGRARGNFSGIGGHHAIYFNTSSALVMMPIGLATASELGVSALPLMMGVAMGASSSFLTPFANGVSLCNDDDAEVLLKTIIVVCPEEAIAN